MDGGRNLVVGTYVYALLLGMSVPDVSGKALAALGTTELRHLRPGPSRRHPVRRDHRRSQAPLEVAARRRHRRRRDPGGESGRRGRVPVRAQLPGAEAPMIGPILDADEFAGRVCIVTGAARGIGAAIAGSLARLGGTVIVADIDLESAAQRSEILAGEGLDATPWQLDVSDAAGIDELVRGVTERLGPPTVLINNAGIVTVAPSDELARGRMAPAGRRDADGDVPDDAGGRADDACRRGRRPIVNLSSIGALRGAPGRSAYNAAKAGISCLTQVLGVEWAARGVRVNAVAPAVTRTEMLEHVLRTLDGATKRGGVRRAHADGPRRRAGGDRRLRRLPRLATRPSFITGTTLLIDGGWMASTGIPAEAGRLSAYVLTGGTDTFCRPARRHPAGAGASASRPGHRHRGSMWSPGRAWPTRRPSSCPPPCHAADEHLPRGEGAAFIAVVPLWGVSPRRTTRSPRACRRCRPLAGDRARSSAGRDEGRRINVSPTARSTRPRPRLRPARRAGRADADAPAGERRQSWPTRSISWPRPRPPMSPAACSTCRRRLDGVLLVLPRPRPLAEKEPHDIPQRTSAPGRTGCDSS